MSRGDGYFQRAVIGALTEAAEESLTMEGLRWRLYEDSGKPPLQPGEELPSAWNTSFRRTIIGLERHGRINIDSRPLESLEECIIHYPGKTLSASARLLRAKLLPVILDWSRKEGGLKPRYGDAANEDYQVKKLRKEGKWAELSDQWQLLEERLRPLYGKASSSPDDFLRLICKGRNLFRTTDIETGISFSLAVSKVRRSGQSPTDLTDDLQAFLELFMPAGQAGSLKLHGFMHELAEVPRHGQCKLRDSTLDYLHTHQKELVESMPGFQRKPAPPFQGFYGVREEYTYDPDLVKLFDQTVFQDFKFISLN